jgi:hypothetical protein
MRISHAKWTSDHPRQSHLMNLAMMPFLRAISAKVNDTTTLSLPLWRMGLLH